MVVNTFFGMEIITEKPEEDIFTLKFKPNKGLTFYRSTQLDLMCLGFRK